MPSVNDVIRIDDQWYVLASSSRADDRTQVLKHGETFAVFDRHGDIYHLGVGEQGIYHEGTRFLSHLELSVNDRRPMLLNSTVKRDNTLLVVDLTTPDLYLEGERILEKGVVHIFRAMLLWQSVYYEHVRVVNFAERPVEMSLAFAFGADFADIFEVRGVERPARGAPREPVLTGHELLLGYEGLDGVSRRTRIGFSRLPEAGPDRLMRFPLLLEPRVEEELYITVACETDSREPPVIGYREALSRRSDAVTEALSEMATIDSSNEQFNDWLNRSVADLRMLVTDSEGGPYPYAGVPWFSTAFGRDGIIAALQSLWFYPGLARGVLAFLAAHQATEVEPARDAEPGKILHETRKGEMSALGEVPFGCYYGSVDSTPLFVLLAGAYYERTGDLGFLVSIWPNILQALAWCDQYGDADGDGFVEYARHSVNGLVQQGWKDSNDSVFHADGTLAGAPIAVCEVQGYVYAAKVSAARLARALGHEERAVALEQQARQLKKRFNEAFWCEEIGTFAIALDGSKKPCRVRSSNPGHALFTGIADPAYAARVAESLLSEALFNGWGVRTLASGERRYNPMSYHNGSVWPHDNGILGMGLARYGFKDKALEILTGLFDASTFLELHRLPELFCGFARLPGQGPTLYPVACSPQAWASGAVFQLLQACLGMTFATDKPQLQFHHPQLPVYLEHLRITNLRVGNGVVDLALQRHANDVGFNVTRKEGDVDIAVIV